MPGERNLWRDRAELYTYETPIVTRREFLRASAWMTMNIAMTSLPGLEAETSRQEKTEGKRLKQDLCWWCYSGRVEPKKLIQEAAKIGYAGLELAPEEMWDEIRAAGLRITTTGGHQSISDGLNDKRQHSRIEEEIHQSIEKALKYDIPVLICFSGNRRGISDQEGLENTVEGLKRVAKYVEGKGVTLALEILNSKVDHHDYQFDHLPWGVEAIKQVNSPRVKILYDLYHAQIMDGDLIRAIRTHHPLIAHYHTGGNPGRNEIDETQEIYYPAVMRAIKATGYEGFIGQEFIPKGDPLVAMRKAFEICDV